MSSRTYPYAFIAPVGLWAMARFLLGWDLGRSVIIPGLLVMAFLLALILVWIVAIYSYRALQLPETLALMAIDVDSPELPDEVREEWQSVDGELAARGFRQEGGAKGGFLPPPVETYCASWTAPREELFVVSTVFHRADRRSRRVFRHRMIATWLRDGLAVETSSEAAPAPAPDRLMIAGFPGIWQLSTLIRLHRARLSNLKPKLQVDDLIPSVDAGPLQICPIGFERLRGALESAGYLRERGEGGYRPTLRGWLWHMVIILGSIIQVWNLLERRRTRHWLQEIGELPPDTSVRTAHWAAFGIGGSAVALGIGLPNGLPFACATAGGLWVTPLVFVLAPVAMLWGLSGIVNGYGYELSDHASRPDSGAHDPIAHLGEA